MPWKIKQAVKNEMAYICPYEEKKNWVQIFNKAWINDVEFKRQEKPFTFKRWQLREKNEFQTKSEINDPPLFITVHIFGDEYQFISKDTGRCKQDLEWYPDYSNTVTGEDKSLKEKLGPNFNWIFILSVYSRFQLKKTVMTHDCPERTV